ncbi:hypothetical protein F4778DRAFT_715831 [Xylariomycetidae sp. FL2044]|nr:hypothetical protein F4778DRAFT_715831 [Xylariomycetidae sp. FL2044]
MLTPTQCITDACAFIFIFFGSLDSLQLHCLLLLFVVPRFFLTSLSVCLSTPRIFLKGIDHAYIHTYIPCSLSGRILWGVGTFGLDSPASLSTTQAHAAVRIDESDASGIPGLRRVGFPYLSLSLSLSLSVCVCDRYVSRGASDNYLPR